MTHRESKACFVPCRETGYGRAAPGPANAERRTLKVKAEGWTYDADVTEPTRIVYWHRDLPPLDADPDGEHTLEATSVRVPGTIAHRDELWTRCEHDLMDMAERRMREEVARLGGRYAHVRSEAIDPRHDEAKGEAWLYGRFVYTLYR